MREAAGEQGLDADGAWSLMLATSEAVSNAVMHGTPCPNGDKGILLRLLPWCGGLCVEVCDCGTFEAPPASAAAGDEHGRGIPIIAAVVDHFEVVTDGPLTRVRFAKRGRRLAAA